MNPTDAIKIISALAEGIDSETGVYIEGESPLNSPHVIRALFLAVRALDALPEQKVKRPPVPGLESAGAPWTPEEDERLLRKFDAGAKVASLASIHRRTPGAITARLVKHGRITIPTNDAGDA